MGLDAVELVMMYEEAFGIEIPDRDASEMRTPRDMINFVAARLPVANSPDCLRQRAFYLLRRKAAEVLGTARKEFRLDTPLKSLLTEQDKTAHWKRFGEAVGAKRWPELTFSWSLPRRIFYRPGIGHQTVRDLAEFIVANEPQLVTTEAAWTRERIASVIRDITIANLVPPKDYGEDRAYVRDMGID